MIKAGAFDKFEKRDYLLHNIETLILVANKEHKRKSSGQTDLFGDEQTSSPISIKDSLSDAYEKLHARDMLIWERELLGIYVSQHPLEAFEEILSEKEREIQMLREELN